MNGESGSPGGGNGGSPPTETQVLIIGGGPVGLAAGMELGTRGIDCVVVEPRTTISRSRPRAKTTNARTMEHFRRWGLAERIREIAPLPVDWSQDVVFCTTLLGKEIARIHGVLGLAPQGSELFSEPGQQIPQFLVEEVLREGVTALPNCSFAVGWRLESLTQDDHEVRVVLILDGTEERHEIVADYVIGCDGAWSAVREQVGSAYEGEADPRPFFSIVFRAPGLAERHSHGPAIHYWILNPEFPGVMGRLDLEDTWWMMVGGVDSDTGNADPEALIHGVSGEPVEAEVLSTDPWSSRMLLVDRAQVGRVFLAGDAAHLNPPWGGHGFNTGVGDAVDLGWKLAAVLDGWGGDDLLDAYEAERRPVHQRVIREAVKNLSVLSADLAAADLTAPGDAGEEARQRGAERIYAAKTREFHSLGLVLGYRYDGSPLVVDEGTPPPPDELVEFHPTARPGARLPHAWLGDGRSLFDELGPGFSLLRLGERAATGPLVTAAKSQGVPLKVVDLAQKGLRDRYEADLLLVRPDQHVAWRGDAASDDPAALVDLIRGEETGVNSSRANQKAQETRKRR